MRTTLQVARYTVRDLARSRWLIAYALFFFFATFLLLRFSDSETKALLSLSNVVLFVVPLANIVFGAMYLYTAREFVELLLAQPIQRRQLFVGLFGGLMIPVAVAAALGIAIPLVLSRASGGALLIGLAVAGIAAALSAVFTAVASVVAYWIEDRVRGLAVAIGLWLLLALVYDAAVLMASVQFADYPLERPLLVAMFMNPIDLARLMLLTQFDVAALLGYTGALFESMVTGVLGVLIAALALAAWIGVPAWLGLRRFLAKDF